MGITHDTYLLYKWKLLQDLTSDMLQDVSIRFQSQMIGLKENCCSPLIHLALGSWTLKFLPKTSSTVSFPFKARLSSSPDTGDRKKNHDRHSKSHSKHRKKNQNGAFSHNTLHKGWIRTFRMRIRTSHELECRLSLFGWSGKNKHSVCGYYKTKKKKRQQTQRIMLPRNRKVA